VQNTAFGANSAPLTCFKTSENTVDPDPATVFSFVCQQCQCLPRNRDKHPCGRLLSVNVQ
jgi:hypothetical protein